MITRPTAESWRSFSASGAWNPRSSKVDQQHWPHSTSGARSGDPFALVLLDSMMPEMDGFAVAERIQRNSAMAGPIMMMLSSADRRGDATRCRELGVASFLVKPVRQSTLLDSIMTALGSQTWRRASRAPSRRNRLTSAESSLEILLAEDNAVNQKLAIRLLEKRGHSVMLAVTVAQHSPHWKRSVSTWC